MNVLLWSPHGAGLHYGGAGTNAYRLYGSKAIPGLKVTLVCANLEQQKYPVFSEVISLHRHSNRSVSDHLCYMYKAKQWLRKNAHKYDIFHGIDIFENTVRPAIWAESLGLPAVVKPASHGTGLVAARGLKCIFRLPERRRFLLKKISGVIAISSAIKSEMESYGIRNIYSIPNGVDDKRFRPPLSIGERIQLRRRLGFADDSVVVLYVGAIASRKQPIWLVEALAPIMKRNARLKLLYVGPEREAGHLDLLQKNIAEAGIMDRTSVLDLRTDIELYYRAADIFCLPSLQEGMPNSVLEAMSSGLPCIVTRISGSEDLVEDGQSGFFIDSPEALGSAVARYLGDPSLAVKHGQNGREAIRRGYSCDAVLDAHIKLFSDVLSAKSVNRMGR